MEGRLLLSRSTVPPVNFNHPYLHPLGVPLVRPNTPVAPYGTPSNRNPSFIDPTVHIISGNHVIISYKSFVGPFATLDARSGFIKIGNGSSILDNAVIQSNPNGSRHPTNSVIIGDLVSIGFGATVQGPSTIGAFGTTNQATLIGPNAVIDGATILPGAIVGALAHVGPGVIVPTGFQVPPGANVTTANRDSLIFRTPDTDATVPPDRPYAISKAAATQTVLNNQSLAAGFTTLYQGNAATGVSPGVPTTVTGVNNGNLTQVEGSSPEPGTQASPATPFTIASSNTTPVFPAPRGQQQPGQLYGFRARVVGQVVFHQQAGQVAHHLGFQNAIRADQGQPITIGSIAKTGNHVTINSPLTLSSTTGPNGLAPLTIDQNFRADDHSVILGAQGVNMNIGDNVTVGTGAVVVGTTIGPNSTIGPGAYVANSTIQANQNIPAGAIIINQRIP
jgi:carbonic anhydrase/acetyltransferase-like protein (isoleucine patch superfamily)